MQKFYISILSLMISIGVFSQKIAWQRDVSSSSQDFLSNLTSTIDGQILLIGSSIQSDSQQTRSNIVNNGYDYHIIKVDQQGQKLWEKYFSGNQHDYLSFSLATKEGSFLLAGTSYSSKGLDKKYQSFGGSDMWIIKLDESGNEQWQKTIGTSQNEEAITAAQTTDLGYIIAGSTNNKKLSFGQKDVMLVKLDSQGHIINQLILGGNGMDEVESIIATKDGGALLGIYSRSQQYKGDLKTSIKYGSFTKENSYQDSNDSNGIANVIGVGYNSSEDDSEIHFYAKQSENYGDGDFWIVKVNKSGKVEWEKSFGGKEDDHIRSLSHTDNGYVIGGESRSQVSGNKQSTIKEGTDLWLIALDEQGQEQWQKSYNFGNRDILMSLNTINTLDNKTKGFLIGGYTQSEGQKKKNDETFWMLYVDHNGEEVWRKYVEGEAKKNQERLTSAILTRDGSYILAGTSAEELGKENWKIIKLKDSQIEDLIGNKNIQIYPNPVGSYCYVEIGVSFTEADLYMYDMTGRLIEQTKTKNKITKLNTASLPQGAYIIKAQTNNPQNQNLTTKIIKE
ncbi:T9SS type A sorting domain-containing protein [Chryseobacterium sp. T1]